MQSYFERASELFGLRFAFELSLVKFNRQMKLTYRHHLRKDVILRSNKFKLKQVQDFDPELCYLLDYADFCISNPEADKHEHRREASPCEILEEAEEQCIVYLDDGKQELELHRIYVNTSSVVFEKTLAQHMRDFRWLAEQLQLVLRLEISQLVVDSVVARKIERQDRAFIEKNIARISNAIWSLNLPRTEDMLMSHFQTTAATHYSKAMLEILKTLFSAYLVESELSCKERANNKICDELDNTLVNAVAEGDVIEVERFVNNFLNRGK